MDRKISNMINILNIISIDTNVNEMLTRETKDNTIHKQLEDSTKISSFFSSLQKNYEIYRIRLYVKADLIYSEENYNFFNALTILNSKWYTDLSNNKNSTLWCSPSIIESVGSGKAKVVSAARKIFNLNSYGEEVGVLKVDINVKSLQDVLNRSKITKTSAMYIQNSNGELIAYSDDKINQNWKVYNDVLDKNRSRNWQNVKINDQDSLISFEGIGNTDWTLVSIIPLNEVLASSKRLTNRMLLLVVCLTLLLCLLVYYTSDKYTKKIKQIVGRMKRVQNGDLDVIMTAYGRDEVGELVENFNFMIKKMTFLIEEQYTLGKKVKNAELKALQAQINPHFLYNSLDVVNCMAIKYKTPEIKYMVDQLSKFYKLTLNKGEDIITIKDELEHVRTYVTIQNKRFDNMITLESSIDERLYDKKILKLILQPLVENSIIHGIMEKEIPKGKIALTGTLKSDSVILVVTDDGVGMTSQKIQNIFEKSENEQVNSYGVSNVNERIKLCFGNKYGLSFISERSRGTTVEITLPLII
jgi:Predicted signal transduction protein with a C-terminal ATPase domain